MEMQVSPPTMDMIVSHIVAAAENQVIGHKGELPWHIPEDLKFFREKTKGHIIIMGRKTWESLPKPLPQRFHIVITRQAGYQAPGAHVVANLDEALALSRKHLAEWNPEVFIVGGGEIYRESLSRTDVIYLTRVHQDVDGDATYPAIPESDFVEVERREGPGCTFLTYSRKG